MVFSNFQDSRGITFFIFFLNIAVTIHYLNLLCRYYGADDRHITPGCIRKSILFIKVKKKLGKTKLA